MSNLGYNKDYTIQYEAYLFLLQDRKLCIMKGWRRKDGEQLLVLLFLEEWMNRNEGGKCPQEMDFKVTQAEKLNWRVQSSFVFRFNKAKWILG